MSALASLLSPFDLRDLPLTNRVALAPMTAATEKALFARSGGVSDAKARASIRL